MLHLLVFVALAATFPLVGQGIVGSMAVAFFITMGFGTVSWRAMRAEAAIRASVEAARLAESRWTRLVEALGQAVYHHDLIRDEIVYSGETVTLCNRTLGEMERNTAEWLATIHPDDREAVGERFERAKREGGLFEAEYRIRERDATAYRLTLDRGIISQSASGEPLAMDGVVMDIEQGRRDEERFRTLFEQSTTPHFLVGQDGVFECNGASLAMLGLKDKSVLIGRDLRRFWPERQPDGRTTESVVHRMTESVYRGQPATAEIVKVAATGEHIPVQVTMSAVQLGDEEAMLVVWHDLREAKRAQSRLAASELQYRELVENLHQIVYQVDVEGNWTYLNSAWERITGFTVAEALGESFEDFVCREDLPAIQRLRELELGGDEGTHRFEMRLRSRSGRWRQVEGYCRPLRNEGGVVIGTSGLLTDETERLQTQRELRLAKEAAERASRAKGEFLAVMSHEIRTPLNGVLGFASLLGQTRLDAGQKEYLQTISACGDSLLTLIDDILDFSRMESGRLELEHRPLPLRECVAGIVDVHSHRANEKGIELVAGFAEDFPGEIEGDVTRLRQVLSNLVGNAIKFTDDGHVAVHGRLVSRAGDRVTLAFRVSDSGVGIPADQVGKLFHPFVQADASTSRRYGGTGLGLAICRRLTEAMGGEIRVESVFGQGTAMEFTIVARETKSAPKSPTWPGRRVLIVDRSEVSRRSLTEIFAAADVVAVECPTARSALTWLESGTRIDLVLLGAMPDDREVGGEIEITKRAGELGVDVLLMMPSSGRAAGLPKDLPGESGRVGKPIHLPALWRSVDRIFSDGTSEPEGESPESVGVEDARTGRDLAVLLVEDNAVNTKLMLRMLAMLGFPADHAADGEASLRCCEERTYGLVLMDVQLPGMDGIEATRRLRAKGFAGTIIALTAHAMPEDRERCLEAGMNDYLTKPVQLGRLREALGVAVPGVPGLPGLPG